MQSSDNKNFIDVDTAFKSKNPGLYRILPGFVISYLKRVIHQDEINAFIKLHNNQKAFEFVDDVIKEFGAKVEVKGLENIPSADGFIIVSNHPLGGLDALALIQATARVRKDIKFIVNDILLQLKNLQGIFTGVNKHGKNTAEVYSKLDEIYASGQGVLIFPAGLVSRKTNGKIRDLEWKKSFIVKSKKLELPVVPVYIGGRNSEFFYNFSNLRKRLGINANIEMLYLPDEMYRQKNKTITVIFGKPIPASVFDASKTDHDWAQLVKEHVYSLPAGDDQPVIFAPKN